MLQELDAFCRQRRSIFYPKADLALSDELLRGQGLAHPGDQEMYRMATDICQRVLGTKPIALTPLAEHGTFHRLYRAVLDSSKSVIVRINILSAWQHDYPALIERWIMDLLSKHGLPALHIFHVDISRAWYPFDYAILEEAKGKPLRAWDEDETVLGHLLGCLGRVVARLHQIETRGFGLLDLEPMVNGPDLQVTLQGSLGTWPEYIVLRLPEHLDVCSRIGAANHQETRRIEATFESAMNLLASFTPALLHGDLGSHNIFSDGTNITALIDWEDSLSGDPVFEIAFWATFHPERRHAAFLDGYRSVCPLPDDFDLRFWLYFLRIALAKTVLRHRLGIPDRPGRSPAAARIQRGLHRVESLLARERRGFSPSPRRSAA